MSDHSLRPRHMVCSKPDPKSDRCRGCAHLPVHDECFACKEDKVLGCPGCKPVSEANEGCKGCGERMVDDVTRRFRHVC